MNMWYRGSLRSIPLHKATQKGNGVEVAALLAQGADVNARDAEGRTPLHHAVMRGHLQIVDILLETGGPGLLLSKDILGCTPVHLAAVQNQVTLIRKLVTALLKDEGGTTPLHEMARRQCMQDFMGFLHLGWDIAAKESPSDHLLGDYSSAWGEVAKHVDLARPGMAAVIRTMGWQPLHLAAMEGKVSLVKTLVQQLDCNILGRSANSWTPMHYAAARNQVAVLDALAQLGCDPSVKDSVSSTSMHVAAGEGHIQAILKLIELGCDPGAKDRDGCTPLYCAAAWNRPAAVKKLDELGCPSWVRSEEGRTPVHVAAEQGWVALIDLLVRELRNKVDSRDAYQFTPLHSAANGGHVGTIQKLIHFQHDVDVRDYLGRTPLHYAALHGRAAAVEELIKQGAAHEAKDSRGGYTPLHLAADAGQCEVISRLCEMGADLEAVSTKGWTPLALANMKGPANVDAIGLLVELGADLWSVMKDVDMETPLHMASRSGRLDIVEKLLRCGADLNKKTKDGSTPLHYAAAFGQTHVLETLVKAGIAVDNRDDARNTPLHLAAGCGFLDTVTMLIKLGADVNARDLTQCTPLQNAAHGTYSALATMPLNGSQGGAAHSAGRSGSGVPSSLHQQHLTPAQQATQAAITAPATHQDGKVPVRTGLAWAALAGHNHASAAAVHPDIHSDPTADYRNLGLLQLLKKASRRRGGASVHPTTSSAAQHSLVYAQTGQDVHSLGRAQSSLHSHAGSKSDIDASKELGYEALLKHTEALQLNSMEQDRGRLIPVAERLVKLGADVGARDMEGRTALHLAAGCGDKHMVVRLVALGTHVNCKDSVGGTPMHHAAMANKKEMMFTLARLGCDWRARAEGIDGATAAFVLCGQHTRTTRQQLVEAKLKRAYQEGQAARLAGQDPLAAELAALLHKPKPHAATPALPTAPEDHDHTPAGPTLPPQSAPPAAVGVSQQSGDAGRADGGLTREEQLSIAQADANMAALLQEEAGKLADTLRKKTKRKKKTGRSSGDSTPHLFAGQSGQDDTESEQPITPKSTLDSDSTDAELAMDQSSQPASESLSRHQLNHSRAASVGGDSGVSLSTVPGTSRGTATAHHSRTSSATADLDQDSQSDVGVDAARQEEIRADLEAAVTQANSAIEAGIAVGDDVLQVVLDELDAAIHQAVEASISAKYSKKVRKRLQLLLQEAVTTAAGDDNDGAAAAFHAAHYNVPAPNQEWQTAGARVHKLGSGKTELPSVGFSSQVGSQSPHQQRRHLRQTTGQAQAQGQLVHALLPPEAQYTGIARPPPPPPPPRQPPPPPPSQPLPRPGSAEMPSGPSKNKTGNAWGVSAMQCFGPQVAAQQSPSQPGTSAAMSAPKHGATTITDPVQMMWQQQQIQLPSPQNPHKGGPQLWPPSQPVAPAQKAVASPSQRRQQQHTQAHGTRQQHSQQHSHHPATQPPAGFQPFQHGLLPQLRTSAAPPSPPVSATTVSMPSPAAAAAPHSVSLQFPLGVPTSLGFSSGSQQGDGVPAASPSLQYRTAAAGLVPHFSAPFSLAPTPQSPSSSAWGSARGSFDGYPQHTEELGSEALSTFHLPEGLAEQLSTSHSHPLPSSHTLQSNQRLPSPVTDAQPHQLQQAQPQAQVQVSAPQLGAKQTKPKLTSPPGFARRLDGAAKPFIPMSAGSESSQQPVQGPAASTPWTPTARGHLRPPPGMGVPTGGSGPGRSPAYSHASSSPGYLAGQQPIPGGAKPQQPANLASGQWALASNTGSAGPVLGTPFSQSLSSGDRPFGVEAHSSISSSSQWQVPDMQLAQTEQQYGNHAAACVLDSDQHETSGLAPSDVLDFLGIGSDEQQSSDASLFERHRSQGPSSNGDTTHSSWLNN